MRVFAPRLVISQVGDIASVQVSRINVKRIGVVAIRVSCVEDAVIVAAEAVRLEPKFATRDERIDVAKCWHALRYGEVRDVEAPAAKWPARWPHALRPEHLIPRIVK